MSCFFDSIDQKNYRRTENKKNNNIKKRKFEDIYLQLQHYPVHVEQSLLYVELVNFHLYVCHEQFDILLHKMDDVQVPN